MFSRSSLFAATLSVLVPSSYLYAQDKAKVDFSGPYDVVVPLVSGTPSPAVSGQLYYDTSSGGFKGIDSAGSAVSIGGNPWSKAGSSVYYNSGNIGLGTSSPTSVLDISGVSGRTSLIRAVNPDTGTSGFSAIQFGAGTKLWRIIGSSEGFGDSGLYGQGDLSIQNDGTGSIRFITESAVLGKIGPSGDFTLGSTGSTPTHKINTATEATGSGSLTLTNSPSGISGNPAGYIKITINGVDRVMPYW